MANNLSIAAIRPSCNLIIFGYHSNSIWAAYPPPQSYGQPSLLTLLPSHMGSHLYLPSSPVIWAAIFTYPPPQAYGQPSLLTLLPRHMGSHLYLPSSPGIWAAIFTYPPPQAYGQPSLLTLLPRHMGSHLYLPSSPGIWAAIFTYPPPQAYGQPSLLTLLPRHMGSHLYLPSSPGTVTPRTKSPQAMAATGEARAYNSDLSTELSEVLRSSPGIDLSKLHIKQERVSGTESEQLTALLVCLLPCLPPS